MWKRSWAADKETKSELFTKITLLVMNSLVQPLQILWAPAIVIVPAILSADSRTSK